jgi:DNA (cytosine-5)-methyltransferase 1
MKPAIGAGNVGNMPIADSDHCSGPNGTQYAERGCECQLCRRDAAFLRSKRPPYEAVRPTVRLVDLFSGCGGLSLGIAEAAFRLRLGIDICLAVDDDPDAVAVYRANFPSANVQRARVESLFDGDPAAPLSSAEREMATSVGPVDVLVAGPPCQGHSDLNNHTRRNDPRNALYGVVARAAEVLRPRIVLIENVPAVTRDVKRVVDTTKSALHGLGYRICEGTVDLSSVGAPQRRRRHLILAAHAAEVEIDVQRVLTSLHSPCARDNVRTVRWAIEDLEDAEETTACDTPSTPSSVNKARIDWLHDNDIYDLPNHLRPPCHQSEHSYVSMYGRLHWGGVAQTVTSGFGSMGQGRYVHPSRRRTLTPHEAARLQFLPDFWDFGPVRTRSVLAEMIGNAAPPVLGICIGQAILKALALGEAARLSITAPIRSAGDKNARFDISTRNSMERRAPEASSEAARRRMKATPQRGTAAERSLHAALDRLGLQYVTDLAPLPYKRWRCDVGFPEARVAVFVDGCFWHKCPTHGTAPKANRDWWRDKLESNRKRDAETNRVFSAAGWVVLRFWEHEAAEWVASAVANVVSGRIAVVQTDQTGP